MCVVNQTQTCKCCGKELPLTEFGKSAHGGIVKVCRSCYRTHRERNKINRSDEHIEPNPELEKFNSRELILELRARGYSGTLEYTEVKQVVI